MSIVALNPVECSWERMTQAVNCIFAPISHLILFASNLISFCSMRFTFERVTKSVKSAQMGFWKLTSCLSIWQFWAEVGRLAGKTGEEWLAGARAALETWGRRVATACACREGKL